MPSRSLGEGEKSFEAIPDLADSVSTVVLSRTGEWEIVGLYLMDDFFFLEGPPNAVSTLLCFFISQTRWDCMVIHGCASARSFLLPTIYGSNSDS